jgi:hypothetical protein
LRIKPSQGGVLGPHAREHAQRMRDRMPPHLVSLLVAAVCPRTDRREHVFAGADRKPL